MDKLKVFSNKEFGDIRTAAIDGEHFFCLSDICKALELTQPSKVKERLKPEGVNSIPTLTAGGTQCLLYVNESNLYKAIFQSRKESAERFTEWVTSEVLPSIRKDGFYQKPMSALELLELQTQAIKEVDFKVMKVANELQEFKQDIPILGIETTRITAAVRKKGVYCLGGKESQAYKDKSLRGKVYSDIYGQLKREFGVYTYKAIKRSQCESAMQVIEEYELPLVLQQEISNYNMKIYENP